MDGCCGYGHWRRYMTREEKIKCLEEYKNYLERETAGVTERIQELKKEKTQFSR
jgi:hypothetical protein